MYGNNGSSYGSYESSGKLEIDSAEAARILNSAVGKVNELIRLQGDYENAVSEMIEGWRGGGRSGETSRLFKAVQAASRAHAGAVLMIAFYQQLISAIIDTGNELWRAVDTSEPLFAQG